MDIDEIDKKILNVLIDDARLSYRQIAIKAKVSVVTVMHRVKKLEGEGIIKKYTALLDYEKLNYNFIVMIAIRISKGKEFDVERKISHLHNIYAIYDITGDFDIEIIGKFKSRQSLDKFVKYIQTIDHVERVFTRLILNSVKEEPIRVE